VRSQSFYQNKLMSQTGPVVAREGWLWEGVMTPTATLRRQVRRLQQARQRWKGRVAAKQREIRKLRVRVRDLSLSRERWKRRAEQLHEQLRPSPEPAARLLPWPGRPQATEPPLGGA
jgi:chromosome segregation ATPase